MDDAGSQTPPAPAGHPHGERCGPVTKGPAERARGDPGTSSGSVMGQLCEAGSVSSPVEWGHRRADPTGPSADCPPSCPAQG